MNAKPGLEAILRFSAPERRLLQRLAVNPSGFVFDPETGHSFTANETGLYLLKLLQTEKESSRIVKSIQADYEVGAPELERDLSEFIQVLRGQLA